MKIKKPLTDEKMTNNLTSLKQILFSRNLFKPFVFELAPKLRDEQLLSAWTPDQIEFSRDKMQAVQHNIQTMPHLWRILQFFTQADLNVQNGQATLLFDLFEGAPELLGMVATFSAIESVHAEAYAKFIDIVGADEAFYSSFESVPVFRELTEISKTEDIHDIRSLFKAFLYRYLAQEGVFLFTFFVLLLSFYKELNLFAGLEEVVRYSMRDELLHVQGIRHVILTLDKLHGGIVGIWNGIAQDEELQILSLQDKVIEYIFGDLKEINCITKQTLRDYAEYNFNSSCKFSPPKQSKHPMPWVRDYFQENHLDLFAHKTSIYLNVKC